MEAIEALLTRRSVKSYVTDKMPAQELIDKVMLAGTNAPTGMGKQAAIIVEITNQEVRNRLSAINAQLLHAKADPFYGAPVVLAVLADRSSRNYLYDGTLVMGNLLNAAHALGLGACWINRARETFDMDEGKQMLRDWGIEGDYEGIGFCILGYPAGAPRKAAPRKPDYIHYVR